MIMLGLTAIALNLAAIVYALNCINENLINIKRILARKESEE